MSTVRARTDRVKAVRGVDSTPPPSSCMEKEEPLRVLAELLVRVPRHAVGPPLGHSVSVVAKPPTSQSI